MNQWENETMERGFTLVELLVSVFVFTLIIGVSSGVFISGIRLQRKALVTQKLLGETGFAMEYMSRAIRVAKKDLEGSCVPEKNNYQKTKEGIKFVNYKNECQEFFWDKKENCLKESINKGPGVALTSKDFEIRSFNIEISGEGQEDEKQPRVSLFLEVEGKGLGKPKIELQTTISQRNLDTQI